MSCASMEHQPGVEGDDVESCSLTCSKGFTVRELAPKPVQKMQRGGWGEVNIENGVASEHGNRMRYIP